MTMGYLDLDDPDVSIAAVLADLLGVDVEQVSAEGFTAEFRSDSTDVVVVSWHSSVTIPVAEWLRLLHLGTPPNRRGRADYGPGPRLTIPMAAERYGVTVSRVTSWRQRKSPPPHEMIANRVVFPTEEMDAWVAREAQVPKPGQ